MVDSGPTLDLAFVHDDLSAVHSLVPAASRRLAALEAELAAAEREAPALLKEAAREMDAARVKLDGLALQSSELEDSLEAQRGASQRLERSYASTLGTLRKLRTAEVVLSTLVRADELAAQVTRATASGAAHEWTAAVARLLLLHTVVAAHSARDGEAGEGGDAAEEQRLGGSLAVLVGEMLRRAVEPLRAAAEERLGEAVKATGWPAAPAASEEAPSLREQRLGEVGRAIGAVLLLQFCEWASSGGGEGEGGGGEGEAAGEGEGGGGLWALEAFVQPLLKRFRYHFEGRRETNRRDKPEWVFAHCVAQMRSHAPLLSGEVQPMLRAPLAPLRAAASQPSSQGAVRERYLRFLSAHCPDGVEGHVAAALCGALRAKLRREMPSRLAEPPSFCHAFSEAIACERELRHSLHLPPSASVVRAFTDDDDAMQLWLKTEREDASARLAAVLAAPAAWDAPAVPGGVDEAGGADLSSAGSSPLRAPACASGAMRLSLDLLERVRLVSDPAAQGRAIDEVLLPTLGEFSAILRAKAAQAMIGAADWESVGALLATLLFAAPLLEEWQEEPPLASLDAPRAVFGAVLRGWREMREELEEHASSTLAADFFHGAGRYVGERRDFRLAAEGEAAGGEGEPLGDLSPALCEPLSLLRSQLAALRAQLPAASLRRAWRSLAEALDTWVYESVVRRSAFSAAGAQRFRRDAQALVDSFSGVSASAHTAMRRLHEVAIVFGLPPPARAELLQLASAGAAALSRRRDELGVHALDGESLSELLASLVVDS